MGSEEAMEVWEKAKKREIEALYKRERGEKSGAKF